MFVPIFILLWKIYLNEKPCEFSGVSQTNDLERYRPQAGFFSCLRTHREVECKTQSFLIYFYLGGFGSYSKLMCSIKDGTESVQEVTQGETANQKSFPESAPDPRGGLSHLFRDMRSHADTGRMHKAHFSEWSLP